ncbi:MAG: DUF342 domain-containing protein [Candidatus Latescibacteria bacterium]|nr:DUF342 domain-containing protein [Candidatus Latescibacterota bacterium]
MAKHIKKPARPASPTPDRALQDVDHFLQEMESLTGEALAPAAEPAAELVVDDPQAQWIAAGLKRSVEELERLEADAEAGEDQGQVFYGVTMNKVKLVVRQDGLRAYVRGVSVEAAKDPKTLQMLAGCGLAKIQIEAPKRKGAWVGVAQGQSPMVGWAGRLEFNYPRQPEKTLSYQTLSLLSMELHQLFVVNGFDQSSLPSCRALAVAPGELLARVSGQEPGRPGQDVFGRDVEPSMKSAPDKVEPGRHVSLSVEGEYRAERYGYLYLAEGRLSVLSPIWIDSDDMHGYWVTLDENPQAVTAEMIHQCLEDLGVVEGLQPEKIQALASQVRQGQHQVGLHLIAQGTLPMSGQDAAVELLVQLSRRPGKELPDGSIDFREVNFAPSVGVGQVIARRQPLVPGTPGRDVKGKVLEAQEGRDQPLEAGANVEVRYEEGGEVYVATTEGVVKQKKDELYLVKQLPIKGDVNFDTGNLDFKGDLYIDGSVVQGFSVKATGDITITGTVEPGSTVLALEDITVGRGILGRRTRVQARGSVRAQFVQEARVEAGRDIEVGSYVFHAFLHAEGKVIARKSAGPRSGSILGGEVWGCEGVEAAFAGSTNGVAGIVVAGLQPRQAQRLDKLKANGNICYEHILKSLRKFNLTQVDLSQIRNMLTAATGAHRKVLLHHAQQLGQLVQLYQKLQAEQAELESQIQTTVQGAEIKLVNTAYWGVTIRIGECHRKLTEDVRNPRFHIHEGTLVER